MTHNSEKKLNIFFYSLRLLLPKQDSPKTHTCVVIHCHARAQSPDDDGPSPPYRVSVEMHFDASHDFTKKMRNLETDDVILA